ncbi:Hypothetical protein FKW44_008528, partial [Caligus rogercresseyi]
MQKSNYDIAASRYSALSLKILSKYRSDVERNFPSSSHRLARVLARIISKLKSLRNPTPVI